MQSAAWPAAALQPGSAGHTRGGAIIYAHFSMGGCPAYKTRQKFRGNWNFQIIPSVNLNSADDHRAHEAPGGVGAWGMESCALSINVTVQEMLRAWLYAHGEDIYIEI